MVEHSTADREVPGSNPGVPLILDFYRCYEREFSLHKSFHPILCLLERIFPDFLFRLLLQIVFEALNGSIKSFLSIPVFFGKFGGKIRPKASFRETFGLFWLRSGSRKVFPKMPELNDRPLPAIDIGAPLLLLLNLVYFLFRHLILRNLKLLLLKLKANRDLQTFFFDYFLVGMVYHRR